MNTVLRVPAVVDDLVAAVTTDPLARFLVAVAVVLLLCHALGGVMNRVGQPPVLGEILGGLVLGPSVLGLIWPPGTAWLFPADVLRSLDLAAQLGLVTSMFLLGCELRTDRVGGRWTVPAIVLGGMGLPFLAGAGVALLATGLLAGTASHSLAYLAFFGLATAVTALPVLARILVELRLDDTPVGAATLAAAAVGDALAWGVLTVLLAVTGSAGVDRVLPVLVAAGSLLLVGVFVVRPALAAMVSRVSAREGNEQALLAVLAVGAIGSAAITQVIGLHPAVGAFLFGAATPRHAPAVARLSRRLEGFAVAILLPLFFAGIGLRTSVGLLGRDPRHWLTLGGVLAAAVIAKFAGAGAGALLAGMLRQDALRVGTLMNCRGVTELVVASIGLQHGLVSRLGFTVLVLVGVITTAATAPLMRLFGPRGVDAGDVRADRNENPASVSRK